MVLSTIKVKVPIVKKAAIYNRWFNFNEIGTIWNEFKQLTYSNHDHIFLPSSKLEFLTHEHLSDIVLLC